MKIEGNPEEWVDVQGTKGLYSISSRGRARLNKTIPSKSAGEIGYIGSSGYVYVNLGTGKALLLHRLIAAAFIPNPEGKPQVNHKDGDRFNNHVSNLEWSTPSENCRHARDVLGKCRGERCGAAKLTEQNALEIIARINRGERTRSIAANFSVNKTTIYDIVNGKTWKHLPK